MSKFYQLEPDEWLAACKELKPAELKVLYRLRTLDPFGQHPIKFRVIDLAKDLDMNKGTISRAVQRLADLGYINLEIVEAIATLTTKSKKLSTDNQVVYRQPSCVQTTSAIATQPSCVQTTSAIATQPDTPQSGSGQASVFSKISLEDQDLLDQSDQDDFLNFENTKAALCAQSLTPIATAIAQTTPQQIGDSSPDRINELTNIPTDSTDPINGDSFRRRVEDFVLKSRDFAPRDRIAYFSRFSTDNWHEWEAKYKATLTQPSSMYKPFVPEKVEVASPDSPTVQATIAEIRKSLGIKT